jgi:hypothetical protein
LFTQRANEAFGTVFKLAGGISAVVFLFALLNRAGSNWKFGALIICALCWAAQIWSESRESQSTTFWAKGVLTVWLLTLPVTIVFAALSGMASEGGYNWRVYIFMGAAFTYPVSIILAFIFRRRVPLLVFLPCLNIIVWFVTGSAAPH